MLKSSSDNRTIKETGFTDPSVFLSVNVWGPVYFAVSGFNAIKFLQSENISVLTEALRYRKQLSTSLIAVGDIIISKSFDKLVKERDVKVFTKRWRDGSQTQQYGESGTGYLGGNFKIPTDFDQKKLDKDIKELLHFVLWQQLRKDKTII